MTDDLVKRLRYTQEHGIFYAVSDHMYASIGEAADRIEELERTLLVIFDYECRSSSQSLIACTARDALWPITKEENKND